MKKTVNLYADFETTKNNIPQVYSWSILYDVNSPTVSKYKTGVGFKKTEEYKVHYGITIDSFMNFIKSINHDAIIYFNNLKGFDGHFILPVLSEYNFNNVVPFDIKQEFLTPELVERYNKRQKSIIEKLLKDPKISTTVLSLNKKEQKEYVSKLVKNNWNSLQVNEYTHITNNNHQIYEIKMMLGSTKVTNKKVKNRVLLIRDNLLLFPSSIENMGKTIVKQLKSKSDLSLEQLQDKYYKKDLQGGYNRSNLYNSLTELEQDGNELEYLIQDTYILFSYHKLIEKIYPRKDWNLTIGQTAYKGWIKTFGDELLQNTPNVEEITLKRGMKRLIYNGKQYTTTSLKKMLISQLLPTQWLDNEYDGLKIHTDLYNWFGGGITAVNEKYRGQVVKDITFVDINSDYPSQMVKDVNVPYGKGVKGDIKSMPFKFYTLIPKKTINNPKGLPFIYSNYSANREYLKNLKPGLEYKFTDISLSNFKKFYNAKPGDYELRIDYSFNQMPIKTFFKTFIEREYKNKVTAKENGNEILAQISKFLINNLYGKFGTKGTRDSRLWDDINNSWIKTESVIKSKFYLPLGIVITELARNELAIAVGDQYDKFVYCDTDSIAMTGFKIENHPEIKLHPTDLGKWDIEFENGVGLFRRPKQYYMINDKKKVKLAFAGINFNRNVSHIDGDNEMIENIKSTLSMKDFIQGRTISNQTSPKRTPTGVLITEIEKRIKPIWDEDYLQNLLSEQIYYNEDHFKTSLIESQNY